MTIEGRPVVVGRQSDCALALKDDSVSRNHARFELRDDCVWVSDLGSRNGTWVNGVRTLTQVPLSTADRISIGRVRLRYSREEQATLDRMRELLAAVARDHLTGLYNRRYFEHRFAAEVAYCTRHRSPLALLALDVDHFKSVNDRYGHPTGDQALRAIAVALSTGVRAEDVVCRIGGEEFMVMARGTDAKGAKALAERLLQRVREIRLPVHGGELRLTISVGVTSVDPAGARAVPDHYVRQADQALFLAKRMGRNQVQVLMTGGAR
jgi:diguanylate cyclase (GGDEF)-like protein